MAKRRPPDAAANFALALAADGIVFAARALSPGGSAEEEDVAFGPPDANEETLGQANGVITSLRAEPSA